jgi:16S rRNA (cytosine967-C5)-methyltransferase
MIPTQKIAAEVLSIVEEEGISAKSALSRFSGLNHKVRGSVHAYVFETLKRLNAIDFILSKCLYRSIEEIDPFIRNLMRIGIYEMKYKGVHPALATDSAVRIARNFGRKYANLVNAVLRSAEDYSLESKFKQMGEIERLSLSLFHPEWFVSYAIDLLGFDEAVELMKANLRPQIVYVRVNELKSSVEGVARYLEQNGVEIEETFLDEVFKVRTYEKHPATLEWHSKGYYVIQDIASCFVAHALKPEPGDVILDLAAAPGIKTSHIAALMQNEGKIVAVDSSKERVDKMRHKLKILGVENVECMVGDGCRVKYNADKALVDAPCSSTGSYHIHPNVKWSFDERKFQSTIKVQRKMLGNALMNAQEVVYATCSITFEENEENVKKLLEAKVLHLDSPFSKGIREFRGKTFGEWDRVVRSYPHLHDCSGFFVAKLGK